jgi:hypothetical protein
MNVGPESQTGRFALSRHRECVDGSAKQNADRGIKNSEIESITSPTFADS